MVVEDLIDINDKPSVMRSLLLRHRHVNEHQGVLPFTKRKYNSYTSLQVIENNQWISITFETDTHRIHLYSLQFNTYIHPWPVHKLALHIVFS